MNIVVTDSGSAVKNGVAVQAAIGSAALLEEGLVIEVDPAMYEGTICLPTRRGSILTIVTRCRRSA